MDAIKKHLELLAEGGKMDEGGRLGPAQETDERFADILICKGSLHPNQKALNSKYPYNIDTNLCEILIQDRGKKYLWEGRTRSWLCFEKKKKNTCPATFLSSNSQSRKNKKVLFGEVKSIPTTLKLNEKMTSILHDSHPSFLMVWAPWWSYALLVLQPTSLGISG